MFERQSLLLSQSARSVKNDTPYFDKPPAYLDSSCPCGAKVIRVIPRPAGHYELVIYDFEKPHDHWQSYRLYSLTADEETGSPTWCFKVWCDTCRRSVGEVIIVAEKADPYLEAYNSDTLLTQKPEGIVREDIR
jgi:hypothetical protein